MKQVKVDFTGAQKIIGKLVSKPVNSLVNVVRTTIFIALMFFYFVAFLFIKNYEKLDFGAP